MLLMRANAENVVVVGVLVTRRSDRHGGHVVTHVHVLSVFAHVGALHVGTLQVTEGGNYNVGIQLHKERDETTLTQVIRNQARLLFCQFKDLVVRVRGDVVDANVRVCQEPLDGALEVLVEAA